jgi:hypothetical protein
MAGPRKAADVSVSVSQAFPSTSLAAVHITTLLTYFLHKTIMPTQTRRAGRESSTKIWFMLVDYHFTRTLRIPWFVDVPPNGTVVDFQRKANVLDWDELDRVPDEGLNVWKLPTPQPARVVMDREYLASVNPREEVEIEGRRRGRGPTTGTGTGTGTGRRKGKGKAKEKAKQVKVVEQLLPSDEMLLYVKGPAPQNRISVLVQLPPAEGTSCCVVRTRRQLIQSRISSKLELQLFAI